MTRIHPVVWFLALTQIAAVAADNSPAGGAIVRITAIPGTPAPPLPTPAPITRPNSSITNGPAALPGVPLNGNLKKEISLTDTAAEASWGRTKAYFSPDIASPNPVTLVTPDAMTLSFKPALLALENRASGEVITLFEFTNSTIGTVLPNSVIWSNVLGSSNPRVSIELRYSANGIQQNVLCDDNPVTKLPTGWDSTQVVLEVWSVFSDVPDTSTESRTLALRSATDTNAPVSAQDQTISLGGPAGAARIVAGGRAFAISSGAQSSDSLPVAKNWIPIPADKPGDPAKAMLVEALDYLSAKPLLDSLPTAKKQASLGPIKKNRSELLRLYAATKSAEPARQASLSLPGGERAGERGSFLPPKMLLASGAPSPAKSTSFLIDFSIISAVPLPSGAISLWPAGGNSLDALTNHNHGTNYNGVLYTAGEVGQGFFLPVSLDDDPPPPAHIRITNKPSLRVTNALTVEAWVNPQSLDNPWYRSIFSGWDYLGNHQRTFDVSISDNNQAYILVSPDGEASSASYVLTSNSIPYDAWTHIAGVYDGSSLRFYVNGALAVTPGAYSGGIFPGTNNLAIGGFVGGLPPDDPSAGSPFFGGIDEPTIYSRALSPSEILSIYNAGPAGKVNPNCVAASTNAVAWWPGDGSAFDIAHTNFGTLWNNTAFAPGVVGQAFSLNGSSDYVRVENNSDLNPTNSITIEAWVYLAQDTWNAAIIRKDGECSNRQYMLTVIHNQSDDSLVGIRAHLGISGGSYSYLDSTNPIPLQSWVHVAEVYNGTNLTIYINGAPDRSAPLSGSIVTTPEPLLIGGSDLYCNNYCFPGLIDEPTIYNRALSGTEISAIYSAGCAGKCKVFPGGDLLTDLQRSFLGLSQTNLDADGDGVPDGIEFFQGRNPRIAGTAADTSNAIKLQVYTPLK